MNTIEALRNAARQARTDARKAEDHAKMLRDIAAELQRKLDQAEAEKAKGTTNGR